MSTVDFIAASLRQMHGWYDDATADLTDENLYWRAGDRGHPIAFILWHAVRTEDNVINFVIQHKPTVWIAEGWNEKFGLHKAAQGTGMSLEEAQNLRISPLGDWRAYQSDVWKATDEFLANLSDDALTELVTIKPVGEMPVQAAIGNMCLTHGFMHLGEIQHLRGLQGLKGMPW
jgi:hypothetical protein